MPRPWASQRSITGQALEFCWINRIWVHHLFPLMPFSVGNMNGNGRSEGNTMTHACNSLELHLFKLHSCATTVAHTTAQQCFLDIGRRTLSTGRQSCDNAT